LFWLSRALRQPFCRRRHRRCRPDVAARLDAALSAGNPSAEGAGNEGHGGGLRLSGALLGVLGLANLALSPRFDFAIWAWFVSVGAVGAKLAALALQYGVFRAIARRRVAASALSRGPKRLALAGRVEDQDLTK
jgi:hypothetical protein